MLCVLFCDQREALWMLKRNHIYVYIQIRPIKMGIVKKSDVVNGGYDRVLEPGVIRERQHEFPAFDKKPNAVLCDVLNLNARSAFSRRG